MAHPGRGLPVLGRRHAGVGFATGVGVALASGHGPFTALVWGGVACATSAGPMSPDMDQDHRWRLLDRLLPDEGLGHGGPMKHRGITHWWVFPALAAWGLWALAILLTVDGHQVPIEGALWAATAGWASHIVADAIFGSGGVPLVGWTAPISVGLENDGVLARTIGTVAPCVAGCAILWMLARDVGVIR